MNLFGNIKFQSSIYPYSNFNTWPNSMLLLFRMTAMENWTGAMMDCMVLQSCLYVKQTFTYIDTTTGLTKTILQGTYLDSYDNADVLSIIPSSYISNQCSPSPILAAIFFTVYIIIVVLIMVDLITGIIIENLESFVKLEEMKTVTQFHVEDFVDKWEELDPHGTGTIHARHFTALMDGVFPPMGVKGMKQGKDLTVQQITYDTSIPLRDLRFHFLETLHRLCSRVAHVDLPEQEEFAIQGKMIRRLPRDKEEPKYTMGDYYTCAAVTSQIKGFLIRVRLKPFWDAIKAEGSEFVYEDLVEDEDEAIFPMLRGRSAKKSAQSMTNQRQHRLASVTRPGSATSGGSVEGSSTSMTKDERMALLEIASGPSMNRPLTAGHPRSRLGTAGAGLKPPSALNPPSDLNPPAKVASSHSAQDAANPARQSKTKNLGHIKMGSLAAKSANASPTIRGEILLAGPFNPNLSASAVEEDTKPHPFDPQPHDQHHHRGVGIGPGSSHASMRPASESSWKRLGADQPAVVPPLAAHVVYANPLAEDAEVLEAASSSMSQGAPSASDLRQTLPSFTTPKTSRSRKKLPPLRSKE